MITITMFSYDYNYNDSYDYNSSYDYKKSYDYNFNDGYDYNYNDRGPCRVLTFTCRNLRSLVQVWAIVVIYVLVLHAYSPR